MKYELVSVLDLLKFGYSLLQFHLYQEPARGIDPVTLSWAIPSCLFPRTTKQMEYRCQESRDSILPVLVRFLGRTTTPFLMSLMSSVDKTKWGAFAEKGPCCQPEGSPCLLWWICQHSPE